MDLFQSIFDVLIENNWLRDRNIQLKDWKSQFLSKRSIYFDFFDQYQSILISFWSLLIDFDLFNILCTLFKWFCHDHSDMGDKFGLKKSIKCWFDQDISWLVDLDQFDNLSLLFRCNFWSCLGVDFKIINFPSLFEPSEVNFRKH